MPRNQSTTVILIEKARAGDRGAIEALFERAYPDLLQAARFRMGPQLRARLETTDLAQTAYFAAFKDLNKYDYRGKGSFYHWLLGILENKIRRQIEFQQAGKRDYRREVGLQVEHAPVSQPRRQPQPSPARVLIAGEDKERIERAMDLLSERHRDVVIKRYYLSMSWAEIGDAIHLSPEAAQMLCRRALTALRKLHSRGE